MPSGFPEGIFFVILILVLYEHRARSRDA